MAQDDEGPELADAVDELHTELWFWQSAMGYTDSATVQGGEKLWGATSQALKAYCASHGLPHNRYAHRRRALLDLAERTGDGFLPMAFGTAESCHANFYNDWMDQEHLETYLPGIQRLVRQLLDVRASDAGGNHE